MDLILYNTRTKQKQIFEPIDSGSVRMYSCGPTVYNHPHIGNFRAYIVADILKRTLLYSGLSVTHVINVTDIGHLASDADDGEDKMTKALVREGKELTLPNMREIADRYFGSFKDGLEKLNILLPDQFPFASDHIAEDIQLIEELGERGYVYETKDGLYFDTSKFPAYGALGGSASADHSRIGLNSEKRDARDFALWKFNQDLGYDAPFGKGFPGWHIECSAMSMKYLGESFDIHTGGIDHIAIHHNNEIAQSECATGKPLARFWIHNEFLNIQGEKIAKSTGNQINLSDIEERGLSPVVFRLMLLGAHYRTHMNFTWEALTATGNAYTRLTNGMKELLGVEEGSIHERYQEEFKNALFDDINTAEALAVFWTVFGDQEITLEVKKATLLDFDRVLGLGLADIQADTIPDDIRTFAEERETARESKDWNRSDELRKEIEDKGYEVKDTSNGYILFKK